MEGRRVCAHIERTLIDGTGMYETYWKLQSLPFSSPNGDGWFYESPSHEEAEARLQFLIEHRRQCGIVSGPVGVGKSTLLTRLANRLCRAQRHAVMLDLCGVTNDEFIWQLADALQQAPATNARPFLLWRGVRDYLHGLSRAEQQTVLIFDHFDVGEINCGRALEQLLHTVDQSNCWCTLLIAADYSAAENSPLPLDSWAELRIDLLPLNRQETAYYVYESLFQAGSELELFEPQAYDAIFAMTRGILRDINRLCELSLMAGMADYRTSIDAETVLAVAENLPVFSRPAA